MVAEVDGDGMANDRTEQTGEKQAHRAAACRVKDLPPPGATSKSAHKERWASAIMGRVGDKPRKFRRAGQHRPNRVSAERYKPQQKGVRVTECGWWTPEPKGAEQEKRYKWVAAHECARTELIETGRSPNITDRGRCDLRLQCARIGQLKEDQSRDRVGHV